MKTFLFAALGLILLASCSSTYKTVYSDYDRTVNFTRYKTFAWLPDKADTTNSPYNNEIIRNNLRNYIGQCLSDRAYSFDAENPDLLLQLVITNTKKERVHTVTSYPGSFYYRPYYFGSLFYSPYPYNYYYNYYYAFGPYSYGLSGYYNTQKVEYVNGAITLNVIDRNTKKLVWTGTAEGDIYDPSLISNDLHPGVHAIIQQYPVRSLVKDGHSIKQ